MRSFAPSRLVVPMSMLALALAGCGGNTVTVQEVPGEPAQLTVPGTAAALAPDATATPTATSTPTVAASTSQATPVPDAGTADGTAETAPEGTTGGGTEAPTTTDPAPAATPPAGSNADEFEAFCAENPGAC
jgi:hypothetical protein